ARLESRPAREPSGGGARRASRRLPRAQELPAPARLPRGAGEGEQGPRRGRAREAPRPARPLGCDTATPARRMTSMSFAEAAERHLDDVYGYLAWVTGDRFVAEDLAAETFERALRLWHRYDERRGSARTWLCQLARTVALDHFRSERRRLRREERVAQPERYEEHLLEGIAPELETA